MSINTNKLNAVLRDNIRELCEHFFPNGKVIGDDWAIGNTDGEPGDSLRIGLTQCGIWQDFATGLGGDFPQLIQVSCGVLFPQAAVMIGSVVRVDLEEIAATGTYGRASQRTSPQAQPVRGSAPFDWNSSDFEDLSDYQKDMLSKWRGYTPEFVQYLSEEHLIKVYQGDKWAFPVAMPDNKIHGTHWRLMSSGEKVDWQFEPSVKIGGPGVQPFVIGDIDSANQINGQIHIFESQWDMLNACDKLSIHQTDGYAAFCTRGSSNTKFAATLPKVPELYAWMQNDAAGENWFNGIVAAVKRPVRRVEVPKEYKDLNDWVRDGYAGPEELLGAVKTARLVEPEEKEDPPLSQKLNEERKQNKKGEPRQLVGGNILQYARASIDKEATLLGDRYLCRDGGMFIVAPSGQGKSSLSVQLACEWSLGSNPLGIQAKSPSRVLIIQGEDDDGDITEMSQWILNAGFSEDKLKRIEENTHIEPVNDVVSRHFLGALGEICELWTPDILFINPYTSYLGGDPKSEELANEFLREGLSPLLKRFHCGCVIMHHTPKTQYSPNVDFTSTDFMYRGAGCATMTNWSRAYMVFEPVNDEGLFRFVAAKRGRRIGWGSLYRFFRHSKQPGVIKWESASEFEIETAINNKKQKGKPFVHQDTVLASMPEGKEYTRPQFREHVKAAFNIGEHRADNLLETFARDGFAQVSEYPRKGTNPLKTYKRVNINKL
jgi:AAA domain